MTSELKPIDIWEDATNAVCQIMQESKMCNCPDGECLASTVEPSKETMAQWNTRAVPDVPELVRYDKEFESMFEREDGRYVLHSQAAEIIAAKDAEIVKLKRWVKEEAEECRHQAVDCLDNQLRAEAAEAKLAQYEAQAPAMWLCINDGRGSDRAITTSFPSRKDILKADGYEIIPLYASPLAPEGGKEC